VSAAAPDPVSPFRPDSHRTPDESAERSSLHELVIRVHGVLLAISATRELHDALASVVGCWHSAHMPDGTAPHARTCISAADPLAVPGYTLTCAGRPPMSAPDVESLVYLLQAWIDDEVVRHVERLATVHAGVVGYGDKALLLPASSGSGKTTLVAALLERGARYVTDEIALLDEHGQVHPYPRPLMMRDRPRVPRPVFPSAFGAAVERGPLPVGAILFLDYRHDCRLQLESRSASHSFLLLLRHTWSRLPEPVGPIGPLLRACDTAAGYEGVRGEAGPAADEILRLVNVR
jgi:hypothetical protein